ncbi:MULTISPECIES: helix-turn-helix domain-containing protein [Pelosinus]|uniref:helix-turn-helix domain-containing protein n=1 Tax=Pelosinus TaxID=365348 RepID=UPI0002F4ABD2|nr:MULTISPECIES: helix-turn-helix transcriptional regulator [Pelosinus]SDR35788.1 DNA-binding transcriptional regulator, XRE-family HTH domain [Pelosinus fermentans]
MIDKRFGQVLKALRTEKGLSQEEFALNIDLHRTYISQLERGLKSPSLRTIAKICEELGVTLVRFMEYLEQSK